ncbi:hypothetical protein [Paenibacillus sp. Soil787]|uniref:hypothetical protein n=1 Tax=Paenibacillus sp. Soil787 TaxID=1736411 RepID=UPI0012E36B1E|nr:hypothetical protein [Paenibacillus sp. Soil787]
MKKITFLCTLLVAAAGVMLSPSFNPQPDPPGITSAPSALHAFNPQPDPPGFV